MSKLKKITWQFLAEESLKLEGWELEKPDMVLEILYDKYFVTAE